MRAVGNVLRLARNGCARLVANAMSVIITIGLVVLPSLFAWYNILACWDVFDNTGNLKVAVANADAGYESDLVPLRVNVGEQVVSALRANDQIDWVFTTEEDAVDGARGGRYYAAVVIPETFSRDMLTFYEPGAERAKIDYYENEKTNAIAPKITDQGASTVSYQVNEVFAETLSETALGIAEALARSLEEGDASGVLSALVARANGAADRMDEAASVLESYAALVSSAQGLAEGASGLVSSAQQASSGALDGAGSASDAARSLADALEQASSDLSGALDRAEAGAASVTEAIGGLFDAAASNAAESAGALRSEADALDGRIAALRETATQLEQLRDAASDALRPAIDSALLLANASAELLEDARDGLRAAADAVEAGSADAQGMREEIVASAEAAQASIAQLRDDFENNVAPGLHALAADATALAESVGAAAEALGRVGDDLSGSAASAGATLSEAPAAITGAADDLSASAASLRDLATRISDALEHGDIDQVRALLTADIETLSKAAAAPVGIERTALYPVQNFGSAMAPLYTALALFIGSLLILVALRPAPSEAAVRALENPKPWQLFLGHFGTIAALSLAQTTVMALGNLLFLQVQVAHPLLFLVCFWVSGLVFAFIIYALVAAFANLGKALAVLLLIVQVTGCGGSYPLQILPGFVQAVSPFLPATHVVDALRAAMMGTYGTDFWVSIGCLALFVIPAAVIGLVLRKPLSRFMAWFVEHAESSKLIG